MVCMYIFIVSEFLHPCANKHTISNPGMVCMQTIPELDVSVGNIVFLPFVPVQGPI